MKLQLSHPALDKAASYWNATPLTSLKGSNHFFYEVSIGGDPYIMRLTATTYRDLPAVLAELHWVEFLGIKAPVSQPLLSLDNRKAVPLGTDMIACVFEKIEGLRLREGEAWHPAVFREWGRTMASFHDFSRQYNPGDHRHRQLDGPTLLQLAEKVDGKSSLAYKLLEAKWEEIQNKIPAKDWGIVHGDLTQANMRFQHDLLYLFDFDNCQYAPFLYDMAVTLYVTFFGMQRKPAFQTDAPVFLRNFFAGYRTHHAALIDMRMLECLLDFFNALVYLRCRQAKHHPFAEYAARNLQHGTLHGMGLEKLFQSIDKNQDYD